METPENVQQDLPAGMAVSTRKSMVVRLTLPGRGANGQMRDTSSRDDGGVEIETRIAPRARSNSDAASRRPRKSQRRRRLLPPGAYKKGNIYSSDEDSDEDEVTSHLPKRNLPKRNSNTAHKALGKRSRPTVDGKGAYLQHHNQDMDDEELPLVKHENAHQSSVSDSHGGTDGPRVHGAAAADFINNADV
ncbi:hypothetical protein LTR10_000172 [Elasticomyces elasticus]|nr:hypothetical protein LTR10_000172 [Elasticomyces elasticus]KAK4980569.1 hypothetical protein LTR42_000877 [Elasticomyces elasticus]